MSDASSQETNKVDSYTLVNCIFTGKFSQVWEVIEEGTPLRYAMKLLLPEYTREREQVQSLKWEAKIGKQLEHPNLLTYHKVVATREHAYLLMDLFRSVSLKNFLSSDLLGVQLRIRKLIESLCLVLGYMHDKGWVHKDVKPDNILLNKGGEVKLIDFSLTVRAAGGLARLFRVKPRQIQGTRTYIAPETIKRQPPTSATDIYSLGVTLFEVLTGSPPFTGTSPNDLLRRHLAMQPPAPSSLNPNVTPEMDRLVLRMLAKKPQDRPSAQEVYGEFRSIKPFKEDIEAILEKKKQEAADRQAMEDGLASRLD
ncbi:MAG: serine/threonine protein kinase, partial [Planctomycetes bacterium]|nr:serine/threonine protein kinase [Planctomycetota bacterium]